MEYSLAIIIPIYNAALYIRETLDSLCKQTCKDFQVIMVDDGSTDESPSICDSYAERNSNFLVIHKNNEGVSIARNIGISCAKTSLITFLDSDDWVNKDYVETILAEMGDFDLMFFQTMRKYENLSMFTYIPPVGVFNDRQSIEKELDAIHNSKYDQFGWPWNKVFRRRLIEKSKAIFPAKISFFEDEVFTLDYCRIVQSLKVIPDILHNYRVRENSLTTTGRTYQNYMEVAEYLNSSFGYYECVNFVNGLRKKVYWLLNSAVYSSNIYEERSSALRSVRNYYNSNKDILQEKAYNKHIFILPYSIITYILFHRSNLNTIPIVRSLRKMAKLLLKRQGLSNPV